ncbi:MAG TPA: DUF302 domain-containing protein [Gammaproteobacteria bacterium]|nr:DUF302 domain-containing protein [Gammaproteobacteria bacterium]
MDLTASTSRGRRAVLAALVLLVAAPAAAAGQAFFVQRVSSRDFRHTVATLKRAVGARGMRIAGRLDQGQALSIAGARLKGGARVRDARGFLVEAPRLDRKLLLLNPATGAVVPVRVFVWQLGRRTYVGYYRPTALLAEISPHLVPPARTLDRRVRAVVKAATGR